MMSPCHGAFESLLLGLGPAAVACLCIQPLPSVLDGVLKCRGQPLLDESSDNNNDAAVEC